VWYKALCINILNRLGVTLKFDRQADWHTDIIIAYVAHHYVAWPKSDHVITCTLQTCKVEGQGQGQRNVKYMSGQLGIDKKVFKVRGQGHSEAKCTFPAEGYQQLTPVPPLLISSLKTYFT